MTDYEWLQAKTYVNNLPHDFLNLAKTLKNKKNSESTHKFKKSLFEVNPVTDLVIYQKKDGSIVQAYYVCFDDGGSRAYQRMMVEGSK